MAAAQGIGLLLLQFLLHEIAESEFGELRDEIRLALEPMARETVDSSRITVLGGTLLTGLGLLPVDFGGSSEW